MRRKVFQVVRSFEERMQVVLAYVKSGRTIAEVAAEYDISERTLERWIKEYKNFCLNEKKVVLLQSDKETAPHAMEYATPQEEITALKEALEQERRNRKNAENKVLALNRMIDIAEQQGIAIRKNSGAKQ